MKDTPTTSRKRPTSLPLNAEAPQPIACVESISPPCVLRSAPTPRNGDACSVSTLAGSASNADRLLELRRNYHISLTSSNTPITCFSLPASLLSLDFYKTVIKKKNIRNKSQKYFPSTVEDELRTATAKVRYIV